MASAWTFSIPPIRDLVAKYVGDGKGWADPFAGRSRLAEFTNDMNPAQNTTHHLEAVEFAKVLRSGLSGVLFDPPYSMRQISEHYREYGKKATALDTSYNFYRRVMDVLAPKVKAGGIAISCGWNSNAFGMKCGFDIIEILVVAHGCHHNDTIVTVERKREGDWLE